MGQEAPTPISICPQQSGLNHEKLAALEKKENRARIFMIVRQGKLRKKMPSVDGHLASRPTGGDGKRSYSDAGVPATSRGAGQTGWGFADDAACHLVGSGVVTLVRVALDCSVYGRCETVFFKRICRYTYVKLALRLHGPLRLRRAGSRIDSHVL